MDASESIRAVAALEWQQSLTGFLVRFGIVTAIFLGVLIAILATGTLNNVVENWSRYRCSPFIMPFTELFGYDSAENFQFCVRNMMSEQSGEFFQPIYQILGQYSTSLGMIVNTTSAFRQQLGNFKLSTDSFVGSVMAKIQALMFQLRMTFLRMQTLMGRVYGTMYSIIWMGSSSITAGMNMGDNDLVNFMFEFCFAPDTMLRMLDKTQKAIKDVQIGDVLEDGRRVTSTFSFAGEKTPMVRIGKDVVSAQHIVHVHDKWVPAHQHPYAVPTSSLPRIYCLNVEGHVFRTAEGLLVADYDESEDAETTQQVQQIASRHLNGSSVGNTVTGDYSLGFDPDTEIRMSDNSWKSVRSVAIGDTVYGGAAIAGIVKEQCPSICNYGGLLLSTAQLVYIESKWERNVGVPMYGGSTLMHIITDRAAPLCIRNPVNKSPIFIRDYREAPLPDMEAPYQREMGIVATC